MKTVKSINPNLKNSVNTITVSLHLSSDLLSAMNIPQTALALRIKELMALELFREGCISTGKAAELLEIPKIAFIQLLKQYGVNYFTESPAELAEQISSCTHLLRKESL
jgi:predicted HTH domain antitoxin